MERSFGASEALESLLVPTLSRLSMNAISKHIGNDILRVKKSFEVGKITIETLPADLRAVFVPLASVPDEMIEEIQKIINKSSPDLAIYSAIALTDRLEAFKLSSRLRIGDDSTDITNFASSMILQTFASNLSGRVHEIRISGTQVNNDLIRALAANTAASGSIRVLHLQHNCITDSVASLWRSFLQLEDLNLDSATLLGRKTFKALSQLESLKKLSLRRVKIGSVGMFFQPGALPRLEQFAGTDSTSADASFDQTIPLIEKHPNHKQFQDLDFGYAVWKPKYAVLHRELCPMLRRPFALFESLSQLENLGRNVTHNFEKLSLRLIEPLNTEALNKIHVLCPQLTYLSVSETDIQLKHDSFAQFSCLKTLELSCCSGLPNRPLLPASLRALELSTCDFQRPSRAKGEGDLKSDEENVDEEEEFVEDSDEFGVSASEALNIWKSILVSAPNLRQIDINNTMTITKDMIELAYRGLRNIKTLAGCARYGDKTKVNVAHPSLPRFDSTNLSDGFIMLFKKVPCLQELKLDHLQTATLKSLGAKSTPALSAVTLKDAGLIFEPIATELSRILAELSQTLRAVALNFPRSSCPSLPLFGRLAVLNITASSISEKFFQDIPQSLLRLSLETTELSTTQLNACFKLQHLESLFLNNAKLNQAEESEIQIQQGDLPQLRELGVISTCSVLVDQHPTLLSFSFRGRLNVTESIVVTQCPELTRVHIAPSLVKRVQITENPNLQFVAFQKLDPTLEAILDISSPSLETLDVQYAAGAAREMMQLCCDRLIQSAPDDYRQCFSEEFEELSEGDDDGDGDNDVEYE